VSAPTDEDLREGYERFSQGDFDGWMEFLDPDIELHEAYLAPDAGVYHGHAGVRKWLATGGQAIGGVRFELQRRVADTEDTVVVEVSASGHGLQSGADFHNRLFHVTRWRDGKIVFLASYGDEDEALRAAGLAP